MAAVAGGPADGAVRARFNTAIITMAALVVLALAVRLFWARLSCPCELTWDGAEYTRAAQNLVNGSGYIGLRGGPLFIFPPFYSVLIALVILATHDAATAGITVSVIMGSLFPLAIFLSARLVYGMRAAVFAGLIAAFLPFAVDISTLVLSDQTFLTLAAFGVYATLRLNAGGRWTDGAYAGLAFGLAYLTRPEGLVIGAGALAACAFSAAFMRAQRRQLLAAMAVFACVFAVLAAPYVVFLSAHAHALRFEGKSAVNSVIADAMRKGLPYVQAADSVDDAGVVVGPELDQDYYFSGPAVHRVALATLVGDMAASAARHLIDIPKRLVSRPFGWFVIALLALTGFFAGPWNASRRRSERVLVFYVLAMYASLASVFHFWVRYADGFILVLTLWAGHGAAVAYDAAARSAFGPLRALSRPGVLAAALAIVLLGLTVDMRQSFRDNVNDSGSITERTAGEWLAQHDVPGGRIFSVSDQGPFYADGTWIMAPWAPNDRAGLRYVERTHPAYLFLDREQSEDRPYLRHWLDAGFPDRRAQLMHAWYDGLQVKLAIYRWNGGPSASVQKPSGKVRALRVSSARRRSSRTV
jgi:hypothetical protein